MSKITKTTMFVTLTAAVLVVGIIAASHGITNSISAQGEQKKFTAKLSGKDEEPPVDTAATGMAQFQLSWDGKEINYDLTTTNLQGFIMAHIHQGKIGENGEPVLLL